MFTKIISVFIVCVVISVGVFFISERRGEVVPEQIDTVPQEVPHFETTREEKKDTPTKLQESSPVTIDLGGKGLQEVPEYVFEKTDTQILNLSNNELEGALQAEVRHLSQLQELNLSHNAFTGVPAEIGQLSNLKILNLSHNKLTGLPLELGNLQNLTVLDLRGNNYSTYDLEQIRTSLPTATTILVD